MTSPSLVELNQTELAIAFGVSPKTIQQYDLEGLAEAARLGMRGRSARYDLTKAIAWRARRREAEIRREYQISDMDALKARKLEAEAESKEIEVEERRGLLMPVAQHAAILGIVFDRIRTKILSWTASMPPLLAGRDSEREIQAALTPFIDEVFEDLQTVGDDPPELREA